MAEDFAQSKTEAPTQRRREEAREQGQVALSTELSSGLVLLAAVGILFFSSRLVGKGLMENVRHGLLTCHVQEFGIEQTGSLGFLLLEKGIELTGLLLVGVVIVGLMTSVLQVGFEVSPALLTPKLDKLDPMAGLRRLFSLATVIRGLVGILKVTVVGVLSYIVLKGRIHQIGSLNQHNLPTIITTTWDIAMFLAFAVAAAMVVIGVLDYGFQRFRHEQSLRMTRQEFKDEIKREEGDPQIKGRIRKLARDLSQRRMMEDVPRATVVITNPTHLAIALRYDRDTMSAPQVVAKGAGYVAQRIIESARRHAVPILERKPLAQVLYKAVSVGKEIPLTLFHAVAEVLAYVYRLRAERTSS